MSNFRTHAMIGAGVGVFLNVAKQSTQKLIHPTREFCFSEILVWGAAGSMVASLPDMLEPATSPNHRGLFHSLAFVAVIIYLINGKHTEQLSSDQKSGCKLLGWTYISHLALDFMTKRGLPFI